MSRVIAVIGAKGFVGGAICNETKRRSEFELVRVHRGDDIENLIKKADVVIHAANPSKRYFAERNPQVDFVESVEKTYRIKQSAKKKKLILISSISARTQLYTVYGRNRRACEMIADDPQNLIVRLGPMFGGDKNVGALHDILVNNPVYVSEKTKYAYVNIEYNGKKILDFIDYTGLIEIGAKNSIELRELKEILGSSSEFTGPDDTQIPLNPQPDTPDARDVISFALSIKDKGAI
ncbi:hypothetical protein ES705_28526 [subsurface metagenome]